MVKLEVCVVALSLSARSIGQVIDLGQAKRLVASDSAVKHCGELTLSQCDYIAATVRAFKRHDDEHAAIIEAVKDIHPWTFALPKDVLDAAKRPTVADYLSEYDADNACTLYNPDGNLMILGEEIGDHIPAWHSKWSNAIKLAEYYGQRKPSELADEEKIAVAWSVQLMSEYEANLDAICKPPAFVKRRRRQARALTNLMHPELDAVPYIKIIHSESMRQPSERHSSKNNLYNLSKGKDVLPVLMKLQYEFMKTCMTYMIELQKHCRLTDPLSSEDIPDAIRVENSNVLVSSSGEKLIVREEELLLQQPHVTKWYYEWANVEHTLMLMNTDNCGFTCTIWKLIDTTKDCDNAEVMRNLQIMHEELAKASKANSSLLKSSDSISTAADATTTTTALIDTTVDTIPAATPTA